jgi:hypothetical protein
MRTSEQHVPTDLLEGAHVTDVFRLAQANINPLTGLASDYLNHFHEAIMLLEMMADIPACRDDFLAWQPMSYPEHFRVSSLQHRDVAIAAYETADAGVRDRLDRLADGMIAVLTATRETLQSPLPRDAQIKLAERAAAWLKPLVAQAGAVINGFDAAGTTTIEPQRAVDALMRR